MHTPKRRSASPHIGRLRPLNPSARTPLQSLPPCARRAGILPSDRWQSPVWASEPIGQPHFPLWPDEPSQPNAISGSVAGWPNEPDRQISRRLPDEPDRRPRFVQANRIRHIGTIWAKRTQDTKQDDVTSPIARIRQRKPPHEPAVLWPNEPERPPTSDWAEMADWAERTQRPRHARSQSLLPFGSIRILAFRLKILPYFFPVVYREPIFFARAMVVPALSLRKDHSVAKPSVGKNPAARSSRDSRAVLARRTQGSPRPPFGQTNPRRQPGQHLAKRSPGAAQSRLWPNKPKGRRVTISAKRTQAADQSASSPNEPEGQPSRFFRKRTQGAAQFWFGLNERTPMHLLTPSS